MLESARRMFLLIVAALCADPAVPSTVIAGAEDMAGRNTETLWRGVLRGDSLYVRATSVPTTGSSWCVANGDAYGFVDTSDVRPKYIDYRVEDKRGRILFLDLVSGPEFFSCCDALTAEGMRWRGGIVIEVVAQVTPCEPAVYCEERRFTYFAGADTVAPSEWTRIPWDPRAEGLITGWANEGCIEYPMTLSARPSDTAIVFVAEFPPDVEEGELIEKELDEVYCPRGGGVEKPTMIELFQTMSSSTPERLVVRANDPLEILSAVIRAERSGGQLTPKLFRLGIQVLGRRGFVAPISLKLLGFPGF